MIANELVRYDSQTRGNINAMLPVEVAHARGIYNNLNNTDMLNALNRNDLDMLLTLMVHTMSENEFVEMDYIYSMVYANGRQISWH
jgi:chorismate mutase